MRTPSTSTSTDTSTRHEPEHDDHDHDRDRDEPERIAYNDSPWKDLIDAEVEGFMRFFAPRAAAAFDGSHRLVSLDTELQALPVDAELGRRCADKLVRVRRKGDDDDVFVLVHVHRGGPTRDSLRAWQPSADASSHEGTGRSSAWPCSPTTAPGGDRRRTVTRSGATASTLSPASSSCSTSRHTPRPCCATKTSSPSPLSRTGARGVRASNLASALDGQLPSVMAATSSGSGAPRTTRG